MNYESYEQKLENQFENIARDRKRFPKNEPKTTAQEEITFAGLMWESANQMEKHWKKIKKFSSAFLVHAVPLGIPFENDKVRVNHHSHSQYSKALWEAYVSDANNGLHDLWKHYQEYEKEREAQKGHFQTQDSRVNITLQDGAK